MPYDPKAVEDRWYAEWLARDYFRAEPADPKRGAPYCITIPPPNITGSLHMGHALNNTVIDALTRWHRMRGFNTLTLPGTDHAGIATQNVVERELAKEGKTRFDLGREAFVERCWEWQKQYGSRIYEQFHKLGCSYDWSRARFTLDASYVDAVHEEFVRWWERGLIYRGVRVVNWCPRCMSAISDIEVNTDERPGKLYHFRYPFADGRRFHHEDTKTRSGHEEGLDSAVRSTASAHPTATAPTSGSATDSPERPLLVPPLWGQGVPDPTTDYVTIATTRPETMLGDTAVAVNPADPRYRDQIGRTLRLPLTRREIPLIADEYAKMEFGTGAVKVTPAHDLDDFEAGLRHNLPQIVVIGEDGRMTDAAGPRYAGLDRFEARQRVLEDLEGLGLLETVEDYTIQTPTCDRCGTVIEPLLSEQWFADQKELARPAIEAVKAGKVRFVPARYTRMYLDWMEKIKPWTLSRQLWWGHRIPVWWSEDGRNAAAHNADEAAAKLGVPADQLRRDEDVLDTWFSSGLWPHATLGWPRDTPDLAFWYPTDLLSTAQEIIYLWVARMIMTGLDFIHRPADDVADAASLPAEDGQRAVIPFRDVYIHATVLDANGARMSKSKGNGVDPLDLVERYGADALRFYLLQNAGKNQDIRFREDAVRIAGTFCNKLWNASRFVLSSLAPPQEALTPRPPLPKTGEGETGGTAATQHAIRNTPHASRLTPHAAGIATPDRWIMSRLQRTIAAVNGSLATYDMDDAMRAIYTFLWDEYCDWYLELAKPRLRDNDDEAALVRDVLAQVLETTLRLLHPMTPFITEEIWQELRAGESRVESRESRAAGAAHPSAADPTALRPDRTTRGSWTLDFRLSTLDSIMFAPYPEAEPAWIDEDAERRMGLLIEAVRAFRNLRAEVGLPAGQRLLGAVVPSSRGAALTLSDNSALVAGLARLSDLRHDSSPPIDGGPWVSAPIEGAEVFLQIGAALDVPSELTRIAKELASVEADLARSNAKLANAQFTERAPAAIVDKERQFNASLAEKRDKLVARRRMLGGE